MRRLAVIPARGGSKRIPRKNIRPFLGRPILAYSIEAARESGLFDQVMVSTDDKEIAIQAVKLGASVPFYRNLDTASDTATTLDALKEVIQTYAASGEVFDELCCIYATSPFVTANLLRRGLARLQDGDFDCVFPALRYSFPIQRAIALDADRRMRLLNPEHLHTRSQDLEPAYHDAGMFYWFRPEPVLAAGKLWTDNTGCLVIGELEAHDIDTEEDWEVAEFKYRLRNP